MRIVQTIAALLVFAFVGMVPVVAFAEESGSAGDQVAAEQVTEAEESEPAEPGMTPIRNTCEQSCSDGSSCSKPCGSGQTCDTGCKNDGTGPAWCGQCYALPPSPKTRPE